MPTIAGILNINKHDKYNTWEFESNKNLYFAAF